MPAIAPNAVPPAKIVIIDNYDSFTYNLHQLIVTIWRKPVDIIKNDAIGSINFNAYDYVFISPGPGLPHEAGQLKPVLKDILERKKIFGVCLGLQAIVEVCGGTLQNLKQVAHGIESEITCITDSPLYRNMPSHFTAGRYHSWVMDKTSLSDQLIVDAIDHEGTIMGVHHHRLPVFGVQYHPESIMTPLGQQIIKNFLSI